MLDGVLDALGARCDDPELTAGVVGVQHGVLRRGLGARGPDQEPVAAGPPDAGPEPLVGLVVHDHVVRDRLAEHVPPHLVGAPCLVDGAVEQRRAATVPGGAAERVRDLVVEKLPGAEVLDPQEVALVADRVGAVGHQVPVGADRDPAEREEVVLLGEQVCVEQHLLARDLRARVELRRSPVVGVRGAPAARAVLTVLVGAPVVPPVAHAVGYGQVGLLGAGPDLGEDRLPEVGQVGGVVLRPAVLLLEVADGLRRVLLAQPLEVVDDGVAVVRALGRHAAGDRREGRREVGRMCIGHARSLRWDRGCHQQDRPERRPRRGCDRRSGPARRGDERERRVRLPRR